MSPAFLLLVWHDYPLSLICYRLLFSSFLPSFLHSLSLIGFLSLERKRFPLLLLTSFTFPLRSTLSQYYPLGPSPSSSMLYPQVPFSHFPISIPFFVFIYLLLFILPFCASFIHFLGMELNSLCNCLFYSGSAGSLCFLMLLLFVFVKLDPFYRGFGYLWLTKLWLWIQLWDFSIFFF